MGGSHKGLSFRDLLCGLVVLTKGELEEKIKCVSQLVFALLGNTACSLKNIY